MNAVLSFTCQFSQHGLLQFLPHCSKSLHFLFLIPVHFTYIQYIFTNSVIYFWMFVFFSYISCCKQYCIEYCIHASIHLRVCACVRILQKDINIRIAVLRVSTILVIQEFYTISSIENETIFNFHSLTLYFISTLTTAICFGVF